MEGRYSVPRDGLVSRNFDIELLLVWIFYFVLANLPGGPNEGVEAALDHAELCRAVEAVEKALGSGRYQGGCTHPRR